MIKQINRKEQSNDHLDFIKPQEKMHWGEKLARNTALAGMLILTIVSVRNAQLPSGETVLSAVQDIIDADWDDHLGKISFVSRLLPETVAVFLEPETKMELTAPCIGVISHAWNSSEPYIGYSSTDQKIYAVCSGQVMSAAQGLGQELILRIRHEDGLESMYYNLASVNVQEGDQVSVQTCLGSALPGMEALIEVRRAGRPIDPTSSLSPRQEETP